MMALLVWACAPVKKSTETTLKFIPAGNDSTEYEIIIIDPNFDLWYQTSYSPAKDYSNEYYRGKNHFAVVSWNEYYRSGRHTRVVDCYIEYESGVDYGIDVNRKLYWYFKFVEEKYRLRLF
jgi:hypothetical protein